MKTIKTIIGIIVAASMFTGCEIYNNHTVVGSGDVESMEVPAAEFSGVSVTGHCNVDIEIGDVQEVVYRAQPQVLEVMTYEVRHGILFIGIKQGYNVNTRKEISATIVVSEISSLAVTGAGDFTLEGSRQDILDIYITGSGNVDASRMEVDDCSIRISGAGDCDVWVNTSLYVQISGVGNVSYMGSPELISDVSGVGNVYHSGN